MRKLAIFLFIAVLVTPAVAQRNFMGLTGRTMLIMQPNVQKDLKFTKDQRKALQAAIKEKQDQMANGGAGNIDFSNPMAGMEIPLEPILTEPQLARLQEIFVQANTWYAVNDPKIAEILAVTDDQKTKAKAIQDEDQQAVMEKMRKMGMGSTMNPIKKQHAEDAEKIKALLTPEQITKFGTLQGKPFKFQD